MIINNPILRGFNPDPSIVRVGDDYFIAVSSFEWFPGVPIYHSKNLKDWSLIGHALTRTSQLDLLGVPDSCGVWAPCLTYDDGTFYLVYSNVKSFDGPWKDTPNYLVTTRDIYGEWSDPIFLNSSGFDGSLFHENNGRKWYTSMIVDHRKNNFFGGIIIQEYDPKMKSLKGPVTHLTYGTELGITEAPHIYQKDGYYFLILAEGGTEYGHAVSVMRSKDLLGPYETHPENPIITAANHPNHPLQKTGHADLVQASDEQWWIVFLTGRPLNTLGRCVTGRETAIEQLIWKEGWPHLKNQTRLARLEIDIATREIASEDVKGEQMNYTFENGLSNDFQSLRVPIKNEWCTIKNEALRLIGRESLSSFHKQSLVARRITEFHTEVATTLDFNPENYQQMAGLVFYYNTYHWIYCYISANESGDRVLQIISCDKHNTSEILTIPLVLKKTGKVGLKASFNHGELQFFISENSIDWAPVGGVIDGSILSDDYVQDAANRYRPAFTGAFTGMCCQDLSGNQNHADFYEFKYKSFINNLTQG